MSETCSRTPTFPRFLYLSERRKSHSELIIPFAGNCDCIILAKGRAYRRMTTIAFQNKRWRHVPLIRFRHPLFLALPSVFAHVISIVEDGGGSKARRYSHFLRAPAPWMTNVYKLLPSVFTVWLEHWDNGCQSCLAHQTVCSCLVVAGFFIPLLHT